MRLCFFAFVEALFQIIFALILTVVVECGISLIFRSRQLTYTVLLCNLLTNPLLNLVLIMYVSFFGHTFYFIVLGGLEFAAVLVEAFVIRLLVDYRPLKALLLSGLFNAASFGIGLLFW